MTPRTLPRPPVTRWPFAALLEATGLTPAEVAVAAGFSDKAGLRWATAGSIEERRADELAVALGLHPALVWPEWFDG